MKDFFRAFSAETLKLRKSLALWLAFISPLSVVALQFLMTMSDGSGHVDDAWMWYGQSAMTFWGLLMLSLFVTLECALVAGVDHQSNHWKRLYSLSVSRHAIYWAKLLVNAVLVAIAMFVLVAGILCSGYVIRLIRPGMGFETVPPAALFFLRALYVYLAGLLIVGIHTWIALRWGSFVVNMGVGIVMTVAAAFVIMSDYAPYFPWSIPFLYANTLFDASVSLKSMWIGVAGFMLTGCVGAPLIVRRDVA